MGYRITDSRGNFVFIFMEKEEKERLLEHLRAKNIAVRSFREGVRITIGKREENDMILKELEVFK
jgi:histidinol-phosphate aminotransferase